MKITKKKGWEKDKKQSQSKSQNIIKKIINKNGQNEV